MAQLSDLDEDDIETAGVLADLIAERLAVKLGPCEFPAWAGESLRKLAEHNQVFHRETLFWGPHSLMLDARANPDGSLVLELQDINARPFWRTTLRPAGALPSPPFCNMGHPLHHDGAHASPSDIGEHNQVPAP